MYLHGATGVGVSPCRVVSCTVVLSAIDSFICLTAVARTRSLSKAVLACSSSKAGVPALETISGVVRAHLDGHLRRPGGEFSQRPPSKIVVIDHAE